MTYEIKENTGTLFKNNKKTEEKQPDYYGDAMIDGVKKRMAVWLKKSEKGTNYMSMSFSEWKEFPKPSEEVKTTTPANELDDEIPF